MIVVLILISLVHQVEMHSVAGHIIFTNGKPSSLPAYTWLTVTIEDTRRADTAAIQLGQSMRQIKKYSSKKDLHFSADFQKNVVIPPVVSVSEI